MMYEVYIFIFLMRVRCIKPDSKIEET